MGRIVDLPDARKVTILQIYQYLAAHTTETPCASELEEKGWIPLFTAGLVGISTNGYLVWTGDSVGRRKVVEQNSSDQLLRLGSVINAIFEDAQGATLSKSSQTGAASVSQYKRKKYAVVEFTSTAGGNLAADETLIAALGGYYGVVLIRNMWSDGAETPTFVIEDDDGGVLTFTTTAFVANAVKQDQDGILLFSGTDDKSLFIDTTSSNLGNLVTYRWLIEYWYET